MMYFLLFHQLVGTVTKCGKLEQNMELADQGSFIYIVIRKKKYLNFITKWNVRHVLRSELDNFVCHADLSIYQWVSDKTF